MPSLKALVIFMGLLIVAGLGLVVYGMVSQFSDMPEATAGFDEAEVPLPTGCSVVETRVDGDRLVVRTDGPDGFEPCQRIIIIDLESGEVLGRVRFKPGS